MPKKLRTLRSLTSEPDPFAHVQRLRTRMRTVPELSMRVGLMRGFLETYLEDCAMFVLDQMIRGCLRGDEGSLHTILATVVYLLEREHAVEDRQARAFLDRFHALTHEHGAPHLSGLVLQLPPHQEVVDKRVLMQGPRFDREVSLGERRWMAASNKRDILRQLLLDHNPMVISRLCNNPRLNLIEIQGLATRRPTLPESLTQIALARRWIIHAPIRTALIRNPYVPTGIALKFLPLAGLRELEDLSNTRDLHPTIHQLAGHLMRLRGPR